MGISKGYQTESIANYALTFVIGRSPPRHVIPFLIYATDPAVLPLLEAPLELTLWNHL